MNNLELVAFILGFVGILVFTWLTVSFLTGNWFYASMATFQVGLFILLMFGFWVLAADPSCRPEIQGCPSP